MPGMKWIPALLGLAAVRLAAQEPRCNDPTAQVQAACNAAVDAYATFQPLAGIAISGGNPELGAARALGGFGHLFGSIRVNAVKATVPNPDTTQAPISGGVPAVRVRYRPEGYERARRCEHEALALRRGGGFRVRQVFFDGAPALSRYPAHGQASAPEPR